MISPIERLTSISAMPGASGVDSDFESTGSFGAVFQAAIENVKQTDQEKREAEYLLATGQLDNPASLTITSTKSELAVSLLVQLRNKALDAYTELTRISL